MAEFQTKNQEMLKRYLFGELGETEQAAMEDAFFADDDLFTELRTLENDLADCYARGEMTGDERARFEKSFAKFPSRGEKIANAAALQKFIAAENQPKIAAKTVSVRDKIRAFFTPNSFAGQFAAAACIVLLTIAAVFLIYDRYRLNRQLADLQNQNGAGEKEGEKRQTELQNQLNAVREREQNLQNQLAEQKTRLDNRTRETEDLNRQIEDERATREKLEKQLENLQRSNNTPPNRQPILAEIFLSPGGGKGGGVKILRLNGTNAARITLEIPAARAGQTFAVSINGSPLASNVKSRGGKNISIAVPARRFRFDADNTITVNGADGAEIDYFLSVEK